MGTLDQLIAQRDAILVIAHAHGAEAVRIFGSVARGEDREDSDVDFLVRLLPGHSLLDLVGLKQDLEAFLHRSTDVATENSLHPLIRERILREAQSL